MNLQDILKRELKGSVEFFLDYTNLDPGSPGYGLTVDSTKKTQIASIASVGFALTAWVIAEARGFMSTQQAIEITRGTLRTLDSVISHYHGFFTHYADIHSGERYNASEYSTIDTALCLNGIITAANYFQDEEIQQLASLILERMDWGHFVFEKDDKLLFRMAFNPDRHGAYVSSQPGFISQWDMAAEQKMMYMQAAGSLAADTARSLYHGFSRDTGVYDGQPMIINPGGTLFAYQYSEAWFDFASYLDPDGIDWFNNTRLAALANRDFCIQQSSRFRTYHARSWGLSAGDCPRGYCVFGATPCKGSPRHNGTVSIYAALSCLPFIPDETLELVDYLYHRQPKTWGKYGFYDAYNLDVSPEWYSTALYGIDKGCSMIMIENYLSGLIWQTYTSNPMIQKGLQVLGFKQKSGVV